MKCLFIGGDYDGCLINIEHSHNCIYMPSKTTSEIRTCVKNPPVRKETYPIQAYKKTQIGLNGQTHTVYECGLSDNEIIRKCREYL